MAEEISSRREKRGLSFEELGKLAAVDVAQTFRICRGEFKTLNPSVLKICNALGVRPQLDEWAMPIAPPNPHAEMLSVEVLAAWDNTDAGAKRLQRILRALRE